MAYRTRYGVRPKPKDFLGEKGRREYSLAPENFPEYRWAKSQYRNPTDLRSELYTVQEGDRCAAPRSRCKIVPGEQMLRHKESGLIYCRKHILFAQFGPDVLERIKQHAK